MHPQRSVITRALGTDPDVDVDTFSVAARPGDVFLICCDGLSYMVDGGDDRSDLAREPREPRERGASAGAGGQPRAAATTTSPPSCSRSSKAPPDADRAGRADTRVRVGARRGGHLHPGGRRVDSGRPAGAIAGAETEETQPRRQGSADGCWRSLVIVVLVVADRRARLVGARALTSLRNRELLYLAASASLTGLGFASVYIARQSLVSWGSLSYALFFFGLYLAAHIVARLTVPNADPYLLPIAGLLTAVGVTEIYRLGPDDAFKQGLWIVIGVGVVRVRAPRAAARLPRARALQVPVRDRGDRAALPAARPGLGTTVNGARLWVHVGPFRFQPGEFSKIFLIVFLAAYLREKREVLAQARLKDVGPLLVIWGACMLVLVSSNDLGSGLLYFGIFLAMLYIATARLSFVLVGIALFLVGGFVAYKRIPHVHERVTIWLHPWTDDRVYCPTTGGLALRQDCESYQLVKSLYSIGNGGFGGAGLGKGTFTTTDGHAADPVREQRLHLLGARAGARPDRRRGAAARLHAVRRARHEDRPAGRRRLLEAARRRPRRSASHCRRSSSSAASCG